MLTRSMFTVSGRCWRWRRWNVGRRCALWRFMRSRLLVSSGHCTSLSKGPPMRSAKVHFTGRSGQNWLSLLLASREVSSLCTFSVRCTLGCASGGAPSTGSSTSRIDRWIGSVQDPVALVVSGGVACRLTILRCRRQRRSSSVRCVRLTVKRILSDCLMDLSYARSTLSVNFFSKLTCWDLNQWLPTMLPSRLCCRVDRPFR